MRSELLRFEKPAATPVDLLTSARRVDMAQAGLIFLIDFLLSQDPEETLDIIAETIAQQDQLAGNT